MPTYVYKCSRCGKSVEDLRPIADRDGLEIHEKCGGVLERNLQAELESGLYDYTEFTPFYSMAFGCTVKSRQHHKELMDKTGAIYIGRVRGA